MAFILPTFNIRCDIYTGDFFGAPPRVAGAACNLAWGRRVNVASTGGTTALGIPLITMTLLMPATTDIRDRYSSGGKDGVEVPPGSGRYYHVEYVDYIGYGFPNAHKAAVISKWMGFKTPDT